MGNLFSSFKKGFGAAKDAMGTGPYLVQGKQVQCPHCRNNQFEKGSAQLNTAGMSFMNLDWANKSATTLACTSCGFIQWFIIEPERID
ncbi:zinc ribbon domain-containing protein [candidate division KSB1 bacterium]